MISPLMEKILISACLIGDATRYDGGNNEEPLVAELNKYYDLVPFCPEVEGGLSTPRAPAEIVRGTVRTETGKDVSRAFQSGAEKAYALCAFLGIRIAVLKEYSPSCGVHQIHNGRFDGGKVDGMGITTAYLTARGIRVISEEELPGLIEHARSHEEAAQARRAAAIASLEGKDEKPEEAKPERMERGSRHEGFKGGHSFGKKPFRKPGEHKFDGKKPFRKGEKKPFHKDGKPGEGKPSFGRKFDRSGKPSFHKGPRKPFKKKED